MAQQSKNRPFSDIVSATVDGFGTLTPDPSSALGAYKSVLFDHCQRRPSYDRVIKKYDEARRFYDTVLDRVRKEYPGSRIDDLSAGPDYDEARRFYDTVLDHLRKEYPGSRIDDLSAGPDYDVVAAGSHSDAPKKFVIEVKGSIAGSDSETTGLSSERTETWRPRKNLTILELKTTAGGKPIRVKISGASKSELVKIIEQVNKKAAQE